MHSHFLQKIKKKNSSFSLLAFQVASNYFCHSVPKQAGLAGGEGFGGEIKN